MTYLNNPGSGFTLKVAETEVFNANSPAVSAWTDLDISAVVGAQPAFVILKLVPAFTNYMAVRKNGDVGEYYLPAAYPTGIANAKGDPAIAIALGVFTDDAGVIEWRYTSVNTNIVITIMGYVS